MIQILKQIDEPDFPEQFLQHVLGLKQQEKNRLLREVKKLPDHVYKQDMIEILGINHAK